MGCSAINEVKEFYLKETNSNIKEKKIGISFRCTYEIKNFEEIQILNDKSEDELNEEIKAKIKILNGDKKEELTLKKNLM